MQIMYLIWIWDVRTAIACVSHPIPITIQLVTIFHSLAVIQEVFQPWQSIKADTKNGNDSVPEKQRQIFLLEPNNQGEFTISVHVVIACISEAVRIGVSLVWVIHSDTVVTCIAMAVLITVQLIYIWRQPAVILKCVHIHRNKVCFVISKRFCRAYKQPRLECMHLPARLVFHLHLHLGHTHHLSRRHLRPLVPSLER